MPDGTRVLVGRTAQSEGEIDSPKAVMTEAQAKADAAKSPKGKKLAEDMKKKASQGNESEAEASQSGGEE